MQSSDYQLNQFVEYIRTKQFMMSALKGEISNSFVHISMDEIKRRFLVNPSKDIESLIQRQEIEVKKTTSSNGYQLFKYRTLKSGYYDLNLLEPKGQELNPTTQRMMEFLNDISLKEGSPSTQYFDSFLTSKDLFLRLFFNVDEFSGRVHTPITNLKREYRKNVLLDGEETTSIDVVTMQPLILGAILKKAVGDNEFSRWMDEGKDIYIMLQSKMRLSDRETAKQKFYEITFSPPNDKLSELFGQSNWIKWINEFKKQPFEPNPKTLEKTYNNLAFILQKSEVHIMHEVWESLIHKNIKFLSIHDEIIVKQSQVQKAKKIFESILKKHFSYFKLSDKVEPKQANNSEKTVIKQPLNDTKQLNSNLTATVKQSKPIRGKLYYRYELKEKFNLTDEVIDKQFEDCFAGALWMPLYEFQSNRP